MRLERIALANAGEAGSVVAEIRAMAPAAASVAEGVAEILAAVRTGGDAAVRELTERFDTGGAPMPALRVGADELEFALADLDPGVRAGLELAIENVRALSEAGVGGDSELTLDQGQRIVLRGVPVARAGVYVPGGRAPYPSSVVMGTVTALAAGVSDVAVCAPPGRDGVGHPIILAACALCGASEVYRMGGAQAIAALAYGTESVAPVDVIVGPGNLWVQEAKRQVSGEVGIDGFAGPSDLLVLADVRADPRLIAFDLVAQAEHGSETLVVAVSDSGALLDALAAEVESLSATRATAAPAACVLVEAPDLDGALAVSEAFAPEHLELMGPEAEALAPRVRRAGCLFVGRSSATAFGDYVAGSNHVLPTAGAARFASALTPQTFRRRLAEVHVGARAARELAGPGAAIARAEGFPVHAESMEARMDEDPRP